MEVQTKASDELNNNNMDKISDTLLKYLSNTYEFEGQARLLTSGSDAKGTYVLLDETIFYPQGGGQPSDIGTIQIDDTILNVHFVSFNNGKVHHYVKENVENLKYGETCKLKIDAERRLKNAKCHTGGHLLASIVESLAPELIALKGYHFPEGPYVEFKGKPTTLTGDDLTAQVKKIVQEKIDSKTNVTAREIDPDLLKNQRNTDYQLQEGKKARVVQIDGFEAVPCGGTHLQNLSEIKEFTIRKIQFPKENTKIGYNTA